MKHCTVCNTKYEDSVSFCPRDGEVLEDDPSSLVGQTLDGQYQIEALLGRGGMGAVYRANHILLGDRVAIKVLPPQMRNNAEWLRRFRREGQAARRFRHPNAVTVYDLRTTADGLIYMVMEYVEGHTLDAELKRRSRFTPLEAMSVLEPVMSVLNAAHQMGVVHRDLKPENIMLGKSADASRPVVKLLDLGIAKMLEVAGSETGGATALTIAGQILGTPYYMSPEQWGEVPRDGRTEIDGRADIYSLGTVFYELVVGKKPFQANTLQELRRQHVSAAMPALHEVLKDVPEAFSLTVARAMSKDRGDRPSTAGELDSELRAALGLPAADLNTLAFANTGSGPLGPESSAQSNTGGASMGANIINPQTGSDLEARNTNSDLSAPTILTVDQEPWDATSAGAGASKPSGSRAPQTPDTLTVPASSAPPEQTSPSLASPAPSSTDAQSNSIAAQPGGSQMQQTIATHPSALSGVGTGAQPVASGSFVNANAALSLPSPAPRRSSLPLIAAVALILLLVVGGIGGFLVYRRMNTSEVRTDAGNTGKGGTSSRINGAESSNSNATDEAASAPETLRYWLDVERAGGSSRLAGDMTLHSGQRFRFHLVPREDGYLYIIGPGEKSMPTTFLTTRPIAKFAKTNQVKGGADFTFPSGDGNWLEEDQTTGTEKYTVIFSRTPLSSPAFLNAQAGRALTTAEQAEWAEFNQQHKANSPVTNVNTGGGVEPFVSVKMSGQAAANSPAILDVLIEHQ
ncbi:MAG: eukaryotic-like serine/threonine-protein kinase [Blastocatellia bacterium]|jgi:serine/threonine-protein kinase|nr:eukaryotic-like serine/threonine-protein kinase [Blastocatellia bacterium]